MANPIGDVAAWEHDPCAALTRAQVVELFGSWVEGERRMGSAGPACGWSDHAGSGAYASFMLGTGRPYGLGKIYANPEGFAFVQEMPAIEGYPAVAYGAGDRRSRGGCSVGVGLTDELFFQASIVQPRGEWRADTACDSAHHLAGMMLDTIRSAL